MNEEFYIGYLDHAPSATGRWVRRWVLAGMATVLAVVVLLAAAQPPMGTGRFEFGVERSFEGIFFAEPVPLLQVGNGHGGPTGTNYLVVGLGKHGVSEDLLRLHGRRIRLRGSLIEREGLRMVEWNNPPSLEAIDMSQSESAIVESENLGEISVTGELVDTKCYLGVMRPGNGKVHRGCAVRRLSGGVPPGLLVRGEDGRETVLPLVSDGARVPWKAAWAGREILVRGRLERRGGTLVLWAGESALRSADR